MKILLLGATGKLGQQLLTQSLEKGHSVTALVRAPDKISIQHPQLTLVRGDALDATMLSQVVAGKDAVISSLGLGNSFKANNLIGRAVALLLPVMQQHAVRRLIFVSAFGVGDSVQQANFFQKLFFRFLLKDMYADKVIGDNLIRQSDLDWTIVRPVMLTNGPLSGRVTGGEHFVMKGNPTVSRADTAAFILQELAHPAFIRKTPIVRKKPS